jgi:hypothetical protein
MLHDLLLSCVILISVLLPLAARVLKDSELIQIIFNGYSIFKNVDLQLRTVHKPLSERNTSVLTAK